MKWLYYWIIDEYDHLMWKYREDLWYIAGIIVFMLITA